MDTSQYLSLFIEESVENIENLNSSMLELEKDPENIEIVNEIFRYAHTLKGMAATMGFSEITELTHSMENILDKLRNGSIKVSSDLITVLFQCVDTLEKMIRSVSEGSTGSIDCSRVIEKISDIMTAKPAEKTAVNRDGGELELNTYDIDILREAKKRLYNAYRITVCLKDGCQLKSARAFLVFTNLQQYGEITKSIPSAEDIENENFDNIIGLIYVTQREKEFIKKTIENISDIEYASVEDIDPEENMPAAKTEAAVTQDMREEKAGEKANAPVKKMGQSVRVDIDRLDNFMNLVGELVIHRTRLEQIGNSHHLTELNETLEQVGRITSDLQDLVMKVRMMPLERIFSRFPRMVRDLSTELKKDINFTIKGQETELDRTVIDELGESIVHLLRNAVDHGIESREDRIREGKNPVGNITVTAFQEGNKAVIRLEDDGKGLDIDKIKKKAVDKGINIDGMSERDIQNLIFLEGFSTSDKVTDLSGRGVGMDVVRTKISSIGGSIELKTQKGAGTCFIIHLPLTLSIIQALLVKVSGEVFALSLGFIDRVINVDKDKIKYSNNREVIVYKDDIIPVIRLSDRLRLGSERQNYGFLVIVKSGERQAALMVDSLIGQQEIVIKPLDKNLKRLKEYVGATILGNGRVTLILDVGSLIAEE
jgi:two-component system chemotaxis sensor kinase CheA